MRLKYWAIALLAILFSLVFSGVTQGQVHHVFEKAISGNSNPSILAQSMDSKPRIKFGYIKDSQPVSYESPYGVKGYCNQLKKYLEGYYIFPEHDEIIPYNNRF
ncbi:hypothetical protein [Nostoc sp. GT001]|uniref:hypothetical protein n=1 Tax=Nostoc sp. GT001 TaxID=3056647 RepID=UPI0025AB0DCA|nr:hypothetical protein [Nostoc sp. GT001]MDM9585117.1 hypothetical protein [Nostoc sp. GT001]